MNEIVWSIAVVIIIIVGYYFIFHKKKPYLHSNDWMYITNRSKYEKDSIQGIEVRTLPPSHLLAGEKGVFATTSFRKYDIIGEYTGIIKSDDMPCPSGNPYKFFLTDDIYIDGKHNSNELKYVNSHINIAKEPNLIARTCYLDRLPRVLYVSTREIKPGEELLIDYGEKYNDGFILKK
uniref:SET domain-containing protein n=1 Tax=viral metagenome TaxID=1070528 RepID=A0A6C0KR27_9ZZZZ